MNADDEMSCACCVNAARYEPALSAPLVAATIAKIVALGREPASGRSNRPVRRRRSTATGEPARRAVLGEPS